MKKFTDRMLPPGTWRRQKFELGFKAGRILADGGIDSFLIALQQYIGRNKEYEAWIEKNEPDSAILQNMANDAKRLGYLPKISIVMPTWNSSDIWLRKAIDSVRDQIYYKWELCIADGGSTRPHIKETLQYYAEHDHRIVVRFLQENKGIAGNSQEAFSLATGDFIGMLDHDDELAPYALYNIVKLLNEKQDLEFVYSDEDKIDKKGCRADPFFKPNWSPDMLLTCNYLCHFTVIKHDLMDKAGGFLEGYDGSQDYDLFLRTTEHLDETKIAHIPKILYHWRTIPSSASSSISAKPYAFAAARKALRDAMTRRGIEIDDVLDGIFDGTHRVKYKLDAFPKVSIIIPTKDKADLLKKCIDSILTKTCYFNYEIVIIDNQSDDDKTFDYLDEIKNNPKIRILNYSKLFNYSAINNYAVSKCNSEYVLFLNNDTEIISEEWLSSMMEHAQRHEVGAVGAKLLYPDGSIQHCGVIIGGFGDTPVAGHLYKHAKGSGKFGIIDMVRNYSAVTAACMLTKKSIFEEVGGFDEDNLTIAFNDIDYCLKLRRRGYLIVYTPYAKLYHYESMSRGYEDTPEKTERLSRESEFMRMKWMNVIDKGDPYYNSNLRSDRDDYSIKI